MVDLCEYKDSLQETIDKSASFFRLNHINFQNVC